MTDVLVRVVVCLDDTTQGSRILVGVEYKERYW